MTDIKNKYCNSLTEYSRFRTQEVFIGEVPLGGSNPIRIQSMTTTNTMDTIATVEQTIRMVEAGCDYVRITAPSIKEARNLKKIKEELHKRGCKVPLIADIHFTPNAAETAARIVEKVRINPGNYADKKNFNVIEYTEAQYLEELERIRDKFLPLVRICKEYGTAMRIGTNHGSLSDRIMSRYGDTPLGMVESAMEFLRICQEEGYGHIVLSMKASNPQVMVQAYRLLVNKMIEEGMNYPLHLGVTEAGEGEDGRIKSALGIGALLEDGLGDTIRVSLTEEPEKEAPVAIELIKKYSSRRNHKPIPEIKSLPYNPFEYSKRKSREAASMGGESLVKVFADFSQKKNLSFKDFGEIGYNYSEEYDKWKMTEMAADYAYFGDNIPGVPLPQSLKPVYNYNTWLSLENKTDAFPLFGLEEYLSSDKTNFVLNFVRVTAKDIFSGDFGNIEFPSNVSFLFQTENEHAMPELRRMFIELVNRDIKNPVVIKRDYSGLSHEQFMLYASTDFGALLIEGFGDGVWATLNGSNEKSFINRTLFGILQAARVRISKTEYIACPSCGRTLFDLVEVTNRIRERTEHLKGVKIGIMGCIVNGPGEMADADYGYVGSGPGKITLYRGKEVVKRSVPSSEAVDQLIELIKEDGNWREVEEKT